MDEIEERRKIGQMLMAKHFFYKESEGDGALWGSDIASLADDIVVLIEQARREERLRMYSAIVKNKAPNFTTAMAGKEFLDILFDGDLKLMASITTEYTNRRSMPIDAA